MNRRILLAVFFFQAIAFAADPSQSSLWDLVTNVNADRIKEVAAQHMWLALVVCFFSGMLTSLTPCVYPMIPITINIFGRISQNKASHFLIKGFNPRTFGFAMIYVAGMCATYSAMGLVAGLTGSLFGKVLQSPWMLGFLTILFLSLGLGQLGLFKVALPASWQTKLASVGNAESKFGIFLMGLFSGLIVSPCVGPVIAGILAFVFESSNAFIGFVYFLSFSLGLGVLFLLIGGFSGVLSALPRSGAWMNRINKLLALLMFIAAGYYGVLVIKNFSPKSEIANSSTQESSQWLTDETKAASLVAATKRPLIIDFTAEWCAACHELDEQVFRNPVVMKRLENFVLLRIDVTADNETNEAKLKKYGVFGLPAVVFHSRSGEILKSPRLNGVVTVDEFLKLLDQI